MNWMKVVLNMQKIRFLEEYEEKLTGIRVFSVKLLTSQSSDVINITFQFSSLK